MSGFVKVLGAAALLALVGATAASADSEYEDQARSYLEAGMEAHTAHGYQQERGIPDLVVPLRLEHPHVWEVTLRAGVNYRVYGACDNNCTDLDMEIYGNDGELVDRDAAGDDTPYVQITPERSGRAYVRLWVYACEIEPCYAAARVVSGGTPADRQPVADSDDETVADYPGVVRGELDDAAAVHIAGGYHQVGDDIIEPIMLEGDGYRDSIHLEGGKSYVFQGACDQDCSDVDMEILDADGDQVAQDVAADDRPTVTVRPRQSGDYTVRIWLAQCEVEPCYVGIRGFQR